jgi:tRNA threonylcarbamoyladenosine biosynthesis protein TsaB
MNVLAFETCMAACSAALLPGGQDGRLFRRFEQMERGHSEAIFRMISAVMDEAGIGFADLTTIAVTSGPGSFTGVRAGIAAARGLALGCGAVVVAATSLEVMAMGCVEQLAEAERRGGFLVAHDARRGELYVQLFATDGQALSAPSLATVREAALMARASRLAVGSGAALVADEAGHSGDTVRAALPALLPDARHLARLATGLKPHGKPVSPLYLRAPDAKPQTDKSLARV